MIDQSILFLAKAFLGWDKFPRLAIKLIPIEEAVAFFYPPESDVSTIHVFYERNGRDFSIALFLLFHEAGHLSQWQNFSTQNKQQDYWQLIELDKGEAKVVFEGEAWANGKILLEEFIEKNNLQSRQLIDRYHDYSEQCLMTYK